MAKHYLAAGTCALLCGVAALVVTMRSAKTKELPSASVELVPEVEGAVEPVVVSDSVLEQAPSATASERVIIEQLRAELRRKDEVIRDMAARVAALPTPEPPTDRAQRMIRSCEILDERMYSEPLDTREAAKMESELRSMLSADALGHAKIGSLKCGATICKIVLLADDDSALDPVTTRVTDATPKTFAGSRHFITKSGERAIYFTTRSGELTVNLSEAE